jgi:hypothetical protein
LLEHDRSHIVVQGREGTYGKKEDLSSTQGLGGAVAGWPVDGQQVDRHKQALACLF